MAKAQPGYTRRATAEACGITRRTLDRYVSSGLVVGTIQYVEGHGHMRLFTKEEIERIKGAHAALRARQPEALRRYQAPPPTTESAP
jgi:DNA-binding transcriptional MerR regulator